MTPHWLAHAMHILKAIETLEEAVSQDEQCLSSDVLIRWGATYALQTLSESAHKLPEDVKHQHPQVLWQEFRKIRNNFAHDYLMEPTEEMLLDVIQNNLEPLKRAMLKHIPNWQDIKDDYP